MWFGNPRQAAFAVYLDSRRVGKLSLNSSIKLPLDSGTHYIRIRQWYYLSPPTPVDVVAGRTIRIQAGVPKTPLLRRMARMLIAPTRCLVLTTMGISDAETKDSTMSSATVPTLAPANVGLHKRVRKKNGDRRGDCPRRILAYPGRGEYIARMDGARCASSARQYDCELQGLHAQSPSSLTPVPVPRPGCDCLSRQARDPYESGYRHLHSQCDHGRAE